jgi:glycosyltransferase involved in cell wall biosynthesis
VVVLTRDEEKALPGMLSSVPESWQIVVADAGSRDATRRLARAAGARVVDQDRAVIERARGNFDAARNAAAEYAASAWVLFLDADERLTPALCREIESHTAKTDSPSAAYSMPRQNLFWGKPCRLLGEDRQVRLVRKGHGRYEGTALHQPICTDGPVGRLDTPLVHLNVRSWRDVARRFRRYVPQQARTLPRRARLTQMVSEPIALFRFYYFVNEAHKDGVRGFVMSFAYAIERAATLMLSRIVRRAHA